MLLTFPPSVPSEYDCVSLSAYEGAIIFVPDDVDGPGAHRPQDEGGRGVLTVLQGERGHELALVRQVKMDGGLPIGGRRERICCSCRKTRKKNSLQDIYRRICGLMRKLVKIDASRAVTKTSHFTAYLDLRLVCEIINRVFSHLSKCTHPRLVTLVMSPLQSPSTFRPSSYTVSVRSVPTDSSANCLDQWDRENWAIWVE